MSFTYEYPRPAVSVDAIVFGMEEGQPITVLLIQRKHPPFEGCWAIPGGFLEMDETLEEAAIRELEEETSIRVDSMTQLQAFSRVDRDPRGRNISVAHYTVIDKAGRQPEAADDAREAAWFPIDSLPRLAFDHAEMLAMAIEHLR